MQWEREKMIMEVKDNLYQNFRYHLADQRQAHFGERKKYFKTDKDEDDMELPDEEELADVVRDSARIADEADTIRAMDAAPNKPDSTSGVLLASEAADSAAVGKGIADKISRLKMKQLLSRNTPNIRRQHRSIQDSIPAQNSAGDVTASRDGTQAYRATGDLDTAAGIPRDYSNAVWAKALEKTDSVFQLEKTQISAVQTALTQVRHAKNQLNVQSKRLENIQMEANKFKLERYKKLSYAFTILTMFLIGAPLGSIIKRGGLGIPVIISIGFFILFYVISMVTEKYVKQNLLDPFVGAWMANIWLLPVGIFFLRQARIDARLLDMDYYLVIIQNISKKLNIGRRVTMK
jgi:hypothetical protein